MQAKQQAAYQAQLAAELAELTALASSTEEAEKPVELDQQSIGRLSRMDAMQGQQMAQANKRRREQRIRDIQAALRRLEEDDYGYCLECDEAINPKRLAIDPATKYCIDCLTEQERHSL